MIGVSARKGEKKGDRRGRRDLEVTAESADLYMAEVRGDGRRSCSATMY